VSEVFWSRAPVSTGQTTGKSLRATVTTPRDQQANPSLDAWDLSEAVIYELRVGDFALDSPFDIAPPERQTATNGQRDDAHARCCRARGACVSAGTRK
jgi:1,4-alpha-glucan branching enzyme